VSWLGFCRHTVAAVLAASCCAACSVDDGDFYAEVFSCDPEAIDACGTTRSGQPLICYSGSAQLGGEAFCTESCDPERTPPSGHACLPSGALLRTCDPNADPGESGCPERLNCYRTDVTPGSASGLCLATPVCSRDADCKDPRRSRCAATVLAEMYAAPLALSNLHCIQPACNTVGADCASGEMCLDELYERGSVIPDICIPNCVGDNECPPNFACARGPESPGSTAGCVPGIPGTRCVSHHDCMLGDCIATTAEGVRVCSIPVPCDSDLFCA
jgi:hypothetical protein